VAWLEPWWQDGAVNGGLPVGNKWGGTLDGLADAARRPPPARGGALADGLAFADALAREGRLPDSARVERLAARTHLSARSVRLGERWLSLSLG
jgi:hypothetical protein